MQIQRHSKAKQKNVNRKTTTMSVSRGKKHLVGHLRSTVRHWLMTSLGWRIRCHSSDVFARHTSCCRSKSSFHLYCLSLSRYLYTEPACAHCTDSVLPDALNILATNVISYAMSYTFLYVLCVNWFYYYSLSTFGQQNGMHLRSSLTSWRRTYFTYVNSNC